MNDATFKRTVRTYWRTKGRHDLPWRMTTNPYRILVSEAMLQQTQVGRVIDKYGEFLHAFPTFRALADAPTAQVLKVWQGLGYNRRALMLQRCAQAVVREFNGRLPRTYETLVALPGIGPYTAGALMAFAYDVPHPVIETNIRRVYLHHFFPRRKSVSDSEILSLITNHLSHITCVRDWYAALMDYGTYLGQTVPNPNRRALRYTRQSAFEGSLRQLRGAILRLLTQKAALKRKFLPDILKDSRTPMAVAALEREGFVRVTPTLVRLIS